MNLEVGNIYISTKGTVFKVISVGETMVDVAILSPNKATKDCKITTFNKFYDKGIYSYLGKELPELAKVLYE